MNQPQEGAESILDHAMPTEPVNLTFWQTCKAHPWPAAVGLLVILGLVAVLFGASTPKHPPAAEKAPAQATMQAEPEQTTAVQSQPRTKYKKIARQTTNTTAGAANLPVPDDALGEFVAQIEREKALKSKTRYVPDASASILEQDFETRLSNFERKIPCKP